MDKERINSVFDDLKSRGLLTKDGAFCFGSSAQPSHIAFVAFIVVFLVFSLLFFFGSFDFQPNFGTTWKLFKILFPTIAGLAILVNLYEIWTNSSRLYWYRDRLVGKNIFDCNGKKYMYSDLKRIARCREYDSRTRTYNSVIKIIFRTSNVEPISIVDDPRARRFFSSCFSEIFYVDEELEIRMSFFAKVLKMNALSRRPSGRELQCAVRYFTRLKRHGCMECDESYFSDKLLSLMRQYDYDSKEACVEDCQKQGYEIMARNSMTYANRMDLLACLFEYAYVGDGMVDEDELKFLSQLASTFGIKEWDFLSLMSRFEGGKRAESKGKDSEKAQQEERYQRVRANCVQEACSLLHLRPDATLEEVKVAYRTQVKTCHPDSLPSTATKEEREEAAIRFRAVTEAYDFLCAELAAEPVCVTK
ncbi:MAG: DnaJ domain-containing protein [Paludibacteraceae bacterium]|nr:DnaJ domain-containing protein [Paludibacteraceae bacterium]